MYLSIPKERSSTFGIRLPRWYDLHLPREVKLPASPHHNFVLRASPATPVLEAVGNKHFLQAGGVANLFARCNPLSIVPRMHLSPLAIGLQPPRSRQTSREYVQLHPIARTRAWDVRCPSILEPMRACVPRGEKRFGGCRQIEELSRRAIDSSKAVRISTRFSYH
jgi:hypothetical protein